MSNTVNNYTETDLGNISLNPRGEYDDSAAYEYLDTVSYRGGSYFCLTELETTITGIDPDAGRNSEYWQMIAAPGDMTPEYTAAHNDMIKKAVQVEISRAAVELAQQEIEAVQTDVQQLHSDTVQATQEAENSKNSAANSAQSAEQSRKAVSESEQNINGQIAGFDSIVSEAVEQSKEEINTTKQQAINTITNQQTTSVNTVKTEGEKIITRVGNDAKTVADDRATVEEATQTVLNNAQEVAQNTQTVASNTEKAAASAEGAKTSADNAAQSAKSVEDASKQIEQNKKDVDSLKEDLPNKITKFYASNQGKTHLADSDNGKIMDMMLYGKSSQDGTPTPENPVEIKNVVNPTVKVCGKNLWNPILGGYINGIDGSITATSKTSIAVTDFIKTSGKDITVIARNFSSAMKDGFAYRIGFYNAEKKWIKNITLLDGSKYSINTSNITGTEYIRVSAPSGIYDTIQIEKGSEATPYEPYTEQSVQLPYTLNAISVTSGGNVTIDGQQYIADYVDVERGKYVQMIQTDKVQSNITWNIQKQSKGYSLGYTGLYKNGVPTNKPGMEKTWKSNVGDSSGAWSNAFSFGRSEVFWIVPYENDGNITSDDINAWLVEHPMDIMYPLVEPIETDLTPEENEAFKALVTNYPVTNISVNSEQLDGYTVFNYPISMANGWNYVKQQLNDNRAYIYDMDLQSAEAYVNSEYAVALTELEV